LVRARVIVKLTLLFKKSQNLRLPLWKSTCFTISLSREGASYFKLSGAVVVWLGADSVKFSSHFIGQGPELLSSLTLLSRNRKNLRLPL
jgi:hypothetical protein